MPPDTLHRLQTGQLAGATHLKLSCGLTQFPPAIFGLADTLEVLDLSGNALSELPSDLHRLKHLRVLFASNNQFTHLPESIGQCTHLSMVGFKANQIVDVSAAALPEKLRWLILTDNRITHLPTELGQRPHLQKLMLAGNQLTQLPETLAQCHQLELLRISANRLTALPAWLTTLPRLTWLAFAGNPFVEAAEAQALSQAQAAVIDRATLEISHPLGEGASGVIHAATWQTPQGPQSVAVKRFKGLMTSDGLPASEMAASLAAGTHPQLIGVHGLLDPHPTEAPGVVMPRLDEGYQTLAGPPSLDTCTRDVYADGQHFSLRTALALATGIADAGAHLHARGILHGDLYAHNILWNELGHGILGDFGAASLLPAVDPAIATALTQLEVRALGCLLQELLERIRPGTESPDELIDALHVLMRDCLQAEVARRPSLAQIADTLRRLASPLGQTS
jgi:hypothetical protein